MSNVMDETTEERHQVINITIRENLGYCCSCCVAANIAQAARMEELKAIRMHSDTSRSDGYRLNIHVGRVDVSHLDMVAGAKCGDVSVS